MKTSRFNACQIIKAIKVHEINTCLITLDFNYSNLPLRL